ncbi:MAG: LysE family transporter [Candidatus Micrarchaeota archaeon]|nr:LysE family transporter [Candidatus Micrarchaeota archaeon]
MTDEIVMIISGILFGLTAGISPGPLITMVISETIKKGKTAGITASVAPLITDIPIIAVAVFLLSRVSNLNVFLGIMSILGAAFITYLAFESLTIKNMEMKQSESKNSNDSLKKGILTNLLSPHPYVFYFSVGGPLIVKSLAEGILPSLLFITFFLGCLVGSKIVIVLMVDKSKKFLTSKMYIYLIKLLGVLLLLYAVAFLINGLGLVGMSKQFDR